MRANILLKKKKFVPHNSVPNLIFIDKKIYTIPLKKNNIKVYKNEEC